MKKDFNNEQTRLRTVYEELLEAREEAMNVLHVHHTEGVSRMNEFDRDMSLDMSNYGDQLDSFAQIEIRNREIDQMNFKHDSWNRKLEQVERLLPKAYFGRIDVEYADEKGEIEEFYLGVNSFINQEDEYRVYDWRSPVAELYYNQELGETSYVANGKAIEVDLKRRRQFQIDKDILNNYFDSAVAIEDELLIHALEGDSTQYMQDITATIQKEQNAIIRDMTSQVLLVNGIAGSGKTSAVLQRIAYLLYQERVNLRAEEVVLFAPNPVFMNYISQVLPNLGEKNPTNMTMHYLLKKLLDKRFTLENEETMLERNTLLEATDEEVILRSKEFFDFILKNAQETEITAEDFRDLNRAGKRVLSKEKIFDIYQQTPKTASPAQRVQAVAHHLEERYDRMIFNKARTSEYHDRILQLTEEQQEKYFGKLIEDTSKRNITRLAEQFLRSHYRKVYQQIRRFSWVDFEGFLTRNYREYTGKDLSINDAQVSLDVALLLVLIQHTYSKTVENREVKYVLIDEVQDYSQAQMELIQLIFPRAKFTLLGDENQAIFQTSNSFANIKESFEQKDYQVTLRNLLTSYRSNGPITQLFERLANKREEMTIVLVREDGSKPQWIETKNKEEYLDALAAIFKNASPDEATALITKDTKEAEMLYRKLNKQFLVHLFTQDTRQVPGKGLNILPISLAKGLEFDHVIIHDVSKEHFASKRDRHLLYTMISRAMKSVSLPYMKELTEFLKD